MNRETEARLLEFAASQNSGFVVGEWLAFDHPERDELAAAALFLAGVDWYGHQRELLDIASALSPGSPGNLGKLVARTGFDLSRFSNHLRRLLDHAVAPS